jgi:hypothetical protein
MITYIFGALLYVSEADAVPPATHKADSSELSFPDATNTGVPPGMKLTPSGPLVIKTPGAVIEGLDISGDVVIDAPNVTLRNCKITSGGYYVVKISKGLTGVTVQNCNIDNQGAGGVGISGEGAFIGNNIQGCVDGINIWGDDTVIKNNYIHNMSGPSAAHFDTIQADGAFSNLLIEHNTLINEQSQTSVLMLDNYWGPINNVTINDNFMAGGGYTVYIAEVAKGQAGGGRVTNVSFTNNVLVKGYWGYWNIRAELGDNPVLYGNLDKKTGRLIPGQKGRAVDK